MTHRLCAVALLTLLSSGIGLKATFAQDVKAIYESLQPGAQSIPADQLSAALKKRFEGQDISKGAHKHLQQKADGGGGYVVWCLEASTDTAPVVVAEKGQRWQLQRVGESNLWVAAHRFPKFSAAHYRYEIDGRRFGGGTRVGFEDYPLTPDSQEQPGVARGQLIAMDRHVSTKHYPGAQRNWWVYVPAQYDASTPANLLVMNDGGGFVKGNGNICTVMDNLLYQKKVPVTIVVCIDPGVFPAKDGKPEVSNRSNEYDTCTPKFATFLEEEMLPLVTARFSISDDPSRRAICGSSSGASCAFTAAWHRNDQFGKVISFVGSFCDFRGVNDYPVYGENGATLDPHRYGQWKTAHDYPGLIRKTNPRRNLKIFLQDGENDLDNTLGNWPLNNERMAAALAYAGYEYKFVMGQGIHSSRHGITLLPEALVWLWSEPGQPSN